MGIQFILPGLRGPFSAHVIRFMILYRTVQPQNHDEECIQGLSYQKMDANTNNQIKTSDPLTSHMARGELERGQEVGFRSWMVYSPPLQTSPLMFDWDCNRDFDIRSI